MSEFPAARSARALVAALAAAGVEDYVVCPGSRSGPLAHTLADAASLRPSLGVPSLSVHVRHDERAAGFMAVGLAKGHAARGRARAVAVVTTSGTAVGNLMPAVMEAHHAGLPLVVISADRPAELRGVGANQTTEQTGIFGAFVRYASTVAALTADDELSSVTATATRAVTHALGDPRTHESPVAPGPVHLNVEFRAPLHADGGLWPDTPAATPTSELRGRQESGSGSGLSDLQASVLPQVERSLVIAGDGAGDAARQLAELHGWPLLAEPTSGARSGPACIAPYADLLTSERGQELVRQVHQVVVIGRPTLSRAVAAIIAHAPALIVANHGALWREAPRHAQQVVADVPAHWLERLEAPAPPWWRDAWHDTARQARPDVKGWNARAAAAVWVASLADTAIGVVGASGPIRAVDAVAPAWSVGTGPVLVANRGLAGIDGTISTAVGVGLAASAPVTALMGDVTFLHDVGGLLIGPHEQRPRLRIVVINDGGGTIFRGLEHGRAPAEQVDRFFTTPHGADLAALCAGYSVPHQQVRGAEALTRALAGEPQGVEVVEAVVR